MRISAVHDMDGFISELIMGPDDGPVAAITTRPGWSMTEIELPDGMKIPEDIDPGDPSLRELVVNHRVRMEPRRAQLVRLDTESSSAN